MLPFDYVSHYVSPERVHANACCPAAYAGVQTDMSRFSYRTASVQTRADQAISIAKVCGIVTPDALTSIIRDSGRWAGGRDHLAHVVSYSAATMALGLADMLAMGLQAKPPNAVNATPSALVVSQDQLPLFEDYTAAMMARGFLVAAFTEAEAAQRWAARQAQVREHWRGLRAALRQSAP